MVTDEEQVIIDEAKAYQAEQRELREKAKEYSLGWNVSLWLKDGGALLRLWVVDEETKGSMVWDYSKIEDMVGQTVGRYETLMDVDNDLVIDWRSIALALFEEITPPTSTLTDRFYAEDHVSHKGNSGQYETTLPRTDHGRHA